MRPTVNTASPTSPPVTAVTDTSGVKYTRACPEPVRTDTPPHNVATPPARINPHPMNRFTRHPRENRDSEGRGLKTENRTDGRVRVAPRPYSSSATQIGGCHPIPD